MSNEIIDEKLVSVFLDNNPDYLKTYLNAQVKTLSKEKSNKTAKFYDQKIDSNIIDVTGEIAKRAREDARILSEKDLALIDGVGDDTKKWQQLLNVAIAFIRIRNLKQFSDMVDEKLPLILELAGARLLMPKEFAIKDAEEYGFLVLPAEQIQKIKEVEVEPNIILLGDFNEEPDDNNVLLLETAGLTNLMMAMIDKEDISTYIYRGTNYLYDQIIVSNSILDEKGFTLADSSAYILDLPKYRQQKGKYKKYPFRFWAGNKLLGGYSDHLAVKVDFVIK